MATKKQKRTDEVKHKKTKKKKRVLLLSVIVVVSVVFLAIFFITLFDYIYPPAAGKHTAAKKRDKQEVTLFFSDANERFLVPEKRFIPKENEPEAQAREMVKALIAGSKTGLVNTFPEKAELQDVNREGEDVLSVNFRESLVANHPGGSAAEMATVYSLTNTLTTNLPAIKRIRILIGGKERESLKGHIGLHNPFMMNRELIAPAPPPKEG
ncbi:MAG: GerMN domain-containing protein [Deltaproteobacteria bacterium]|nr:GerMN domain-containing protein [Deltaproteobacteria bacterium]